MGRLGPAGACDTGQARLSSALELRPYQGEASASLASVPHIVYTLCRDVDDAGAGVRVRCQGRTRDAPVDAHPPRPTRPNEPLAGSVERVTFTARRPASACSG